MAHRDPDQKLLAAVVATCGHGLFLGYKYLRDGHVNPIGIWLLAIMAGGTIFAILMVRRAHLLEHRENAESEIQNSRIHVTRNDRSGND